MGIFVKPSVQGVLDALPRPHKPTPMSQLSTPRKLRRVGGMLLAVSAGAMAVSAATASTDWEVRGDGAPEAN